MGGVPTIFRPWFGRLLTVLIGVICAVALISLVASDGARALLQAGPWLALVAGSCWALFWRPHVAVDDAGVHLINVFRTIDMPWPAIHAVDTKFALTLITAYGRFTGWAAPAPGAHAAVRATHQDVRRLPDSAWAAGGIRPGDLPSTPSGNAALLIRQRWEQLRDAGHLDAGVLEHDRAPVRWHWPQIGVGIGLVVLGIVGAVV